MKWIRERVICWPFNMGIATIVKRNMRVHATLIRKTTTKTQTKQQIK